jgi:hypothetical protein
MGGNLKHVLYWREMPVQNTPETNWPMDGPPGMVEAFLKMFHMGL